MIKDLPIQRAKGIQSDSIDNFHAIDHYTHSKTIMHVQG